MGRSVLQDEVETLAATSVATIRGSVTLRRAAEVMAEELVGLLVVTGPDRVLGVLSERDLVQALADGADPDGDRVTDVMSYRPVTMDGHGTVLDAAGTMVSGSIRHLLVRVDDEVRVVSMRDVVQALLGALADERA